MQPYKSDGTEADLNSGTWAKAHVWLNNGDMNRHSLTNPDKHETTIHELGHALSLLHQYELTGSIMVDDGFEGITDPTAIDVSNLQWKY
jgi:hypothetical protein